MADVMTCPLCGHEHPTGTTWCMELFAEIPVANPEPPVDASDKVIPAAGGGFDAQATRATISASRHTANSPAGIAVGTAACSNCGDIGLPGEECRQCGQTIRRPFATVAVGGASARASVLLLPSGSCTKLPRGREVVIGRQSELAEIRDALDSFDGVSRQHCYITVHPVRDEVVVRDPESLNRTWVGDDPREVGRTEDRVAPLPVRLRLGRHLSVVVGLEGAS